MKVQVLRLVGMFPDGELAAEMEELKINYSFPIDIEVPAFTRTPENFKAAIEEEVAKYVYLSLRAGAGLSLGDFALRLLAVANGEPREQERPEGEESNIIPIQKGQTKCQE